jgi:hypothetical protein
MDVTKLLVSSLIFMNVIFLPFVHQRDNDNVAHLTPNSKEILLIPILSGGGGYCFSSFFCVMLSLVSRGKEKLLWKWCLRGRG